MKKILLSSVILFLVCACGPSAPASPTADLPDDSPDPYSSNSRLYRSKQSAARADSLVAAPPDQPVTLATPVCIDSAPMQPDIDRALAFSGKLFETGDWERTYTVTNDVVQVSWYSALIPAIVNLELHIFPCGYEEPDLNTFFNTDGWNIIFGNYQSYQYVTECRNNNGLRLYEFIAVDQGVEYNVRYWSVNDTNNRIITFMIVFACPVPRLNGTVFYSLFPHSAKLPNKSNGNCHLIKKESL
ncbi:MAG: hypothetical protein IPJ47_22750 [Anaerolineales bacterium]|nr:hypothetical protein [Anaerolineales bacterium]